MTISVDAQLTPAADRPAVFEALRRAEERVREIATARAYESDTPRCTRGISGLRSSVLGTIDPGNKTGSPLPHPLLVARRGNRFAGKGPAITPFGGICFPQRTCYASPVAVSGAGV